MFNRGIDRMRRLVCEYYDGFSFGRFVKTYPHLRGTVTDLLIGDLFDDKVDEVWGPMESLYPPDKQQHPDVGRGNQAEASAGQGERVVPAGGATAMSGANLSRIVCINGRVPIQFLFGAFDAPNLRVTMS